MIMKRKNLGATTQHLSLAVMMEAAASTATMMMRTTLEGVMMVMLEGVVVVEGVVVRCHPFSLLGRQISSMPHRIKIMVHPPHNDKREAVDELDLLQRMMMIATLVVQPSPIHRNPPTHIHI